MKSISISTQFRIQCDAQESQLFIELKQSKPFFIMAGPNVVESEEHCLKMARQIKSVTDRLGLKLIFKASFDKANRTSATSFRGPGIHEGLRYGKVHDTFERLEAVKSVIITRHRSLFPGIMSIFTSCMPCNFKANVVYIEALVILMVPQQRSIAALSGSSRR